MVSEYKTAVVTESLLRTTANADQDAKKLAYLADRFVKNNRYAEETQKTYARHLKAFLPDMPELASDVRLEHVEISLMRYAKRVKGNTANSRIAAVTSFFNWLLKNEHCKLRVGIGLQPVFKPVQRCITREEYEKVLRSLSGEAEKRYMLNIFIFLCNTGLRIQEFLTLSEKNFDGQFVRVVGKGRKNRAVPLNASVKAILAKDPELSFISGKSRSWAFWICRQISKTAKIPAFHPHSARHYFATELHNRGVSVDNISVLMGHANSVTTELIYIHWKQEKLLGLTDLLD